MKATIYIIVLLILGKVNVANGLNLNVMPKHIEPGTTENLLVNCSLNVKRTPGLAFLNSLILSRSVGMNKSDHQVVASITSVVEGVNIYDGDGVGSGVVSSKGESYMCLQWAYPVNKMSGTYICEVNGMSLSWKPITFSVAAEVSSSQLSQGLMAQLLRSSKLENTKRIEEIKVLSEDIKTAKGKIKTLENNVTISTNFINKLKDENKVELKTLFFESSVYNGRRFYLSKESALVTYTSAQVTCAKYGGYLAEINDEAEYNFVRKFLKGHPSYIGVIISGSDEDHEGYWTYARNNTELNYTKWYKFEPNDGKKYNCICLWRDGDWYYIDIQCALYNIDLIYAYLCEKQNQ